MTIRRKIACHCVSICGRNYSMMVLHLQDGFVSFVSYLDGEEASTEWLSGTITLCRDSYGRWVAFWQGGRLQ